VWNIFKSKPVLSEKNSYFQLECYKWLLKYFGGDDFYQEAQLVLPNTDFFPDKIDSPEEAAQAVFARVKDYAGLTKWPCKLVIQDEDPDLMVAPTIVTQNVEQNPLGTISNNENNEVVITYNPKLVSNPTQMVATFSHELSHYLTSNAPEPPPGGWDNWEFATDIGATFLGFGIFQENSVFNFTQHSSVDSQGWQTSGGGYLSEAEHSYALAIFILLKDISPEIAFPHCDANIKSLLKSAIKELEQSSVIEDLKSAEYVEI